MYLSKLTLNARHPRTRSEFDKPYELHRTLCKAWEDPQAARVLFRLDQDQPGCVSVVVQSQTEPNWLGLDAPGEYLRSIEGPKQMKLAALTSGRSLHFRLRARPSKRIGARESDGKGKRRTLTAKDEIFEWLDRKAEMGGFQICEAAFDRVYWHESKGGAEEKTLGGVVFEGTLVVNDADKLREAVRNGIGPQKAYGFGLLSLAPVGGAP